MIREIDKNTETSYHKLKLRQNRFVVMVIENDKSTDKIFKGEGK